MAGVEYRGKYERRKTNQQWGGRFNEPTDAFVARFTASVEFDQRMYRQDIQGSVAHAKMLTKVGVLTEAECDDILNGLAEIQQDIESEISNGLLSLKMCT